jgi:hypothetical protein
VKRFLSDIANVMGTLRSAVVLDDIEDRVLTQPKSVADFPIRLTPTSFSTLAAQSVE